MIGSSPESDRDILMQDTARKCITSVQSNIAWSGLNREESLAVIMVIVQSFQEALRATVEVPNVPSS